jgi:hypothetical protein
MRAEFEVELIDSEGRKLRLPFFGAAGGGVEADDLVIEDTAQSPEFFDTQKGPERAGIDPFDKKSRAPTVTEEEASGCSSRYLESLGAEMTPRLVAQINIHLSPIIAKTEFLGETTR